MSEHTKERCCGRVRGPGTWPSFIQCGRKASFNRDGKHYCKTHDPVAILAKRDAWTTKFEAALAAKRSVVERQIACVKACEGIANPAAIGEVIAALREISEGRAGFKKDPLEFANSVISKHISIAEEALAKLDTK